MATCKPMIRKTAAVGDWVVGTGSKAYGLQGCLVYAMHVSEVLSYDEYWNDPRFRNKRPSLSGSRKQAFGDNIYHRNPRTGRWVQANSHHSNPNGAPNLSNIAHDCKAPRVLIGAEFVYWGGSGPKIPKRFRRDDRDVCCPLQGHKCRFPSEFAASFVEWIQSLGLQGHSGEPAEYPRMAGLVAVPSR